MLTPEQLEAHQRRMRANKALHGLMPPHICEACFLARFPGLVLVVVSHDEGNPMHDEAPSTSTTKLDAEAIYREIINDRWYDPTDEDWHRVAADVTGIKEFLTERYGEWGGARTMTEAEHKAYKDAKERERLEGLTSDLCNRLDVQPGSVEFFDALYTATEREDSYREGLREDGLCATAYPFSSAGVEQWYEMRNDSHSRTASIDDVREYVQRKFPLTWLDYQERKRGEKQDGEQDA
jgi:hypothetical protein